jgi:uncharacterized protein (TIGR02453 family)
MLTTPATPAPAAPDPDPSFTGFPAGTLPFLRSLRDGADREWFAAHRDDHAAACDRPAKALIRALGRRLGDLSPDLRAVPAVGGSLFRTTRDRRFAPHAGPYKGYLDLWFWEGERALAVGGLYLRITPEVVRFDTGARAMSREALARYRRAVLDPVAGAALAAVVDELEVRGVHVAGRSLAGAPRGVDVAGLDERRAALLRHTALLAEADEPADGLVHDGDALVDTAISRWRRAWPLHAWLRDHVQG